ncbi:MAG: diphosphomevalonate decarboxylase [Methanotrichaceae archaeon]|nr:diphosphomevalonate decarboxylase [Methanotrichaceae archaeon]
MPTTVIAPTNIAVLKYWGKNPLWEDYNIPTKSSLSFTIESLYTITSVEAKRGSGQISFKLNGKIKEKSSKESAYVIEFFEKVGRFFSFVNFHDYKIESINNFPIAAGFASSASGFAALTKAIVGELVEFEPICGSDVRVSAIARLGSGSAARSIPSNGGFVIWGRGIDFRNCPNPADLPKNELERIAFSSYAETLFGPDHWPELSIIYIEIEPKEKKISSRVGMKATAETNPLYATWAEYEENEVKESMISSVKKRRFSVLARLMMRSSNSLHAMCFGAYPPLMYLNDKSINIINAIHELNAKKTQAAYTFDAGPNPVIITLRRYQKEVLSILQETIKNQKVHISEVGKGAYFCDEHLF